MLGQGAELTHWVGVLGQEAGLTHTEWVYWDRGLNWHPLSGCAGTGGWILTHWVGVLGQGAKLTHTERVCWGRGLNWHPLSGCAGTGGWTDTLSGCAGTGGWIYTHWEGVLRQGAELSAVSESLIMYCPGILSAGLVNRNLKLHQVAQNLRHINVSTVDSEPFRISYGFLEPKSDNFFPSYMRHKLMPCSLPTFSISNKSSPWWP